MNRRRIRIAAGVGGALAVLATTVNSARAELTVSTDFENASAIVEGIDQARGTIRFRPGGDVRRGWPCWWYFRVDGVRPGQTVRLEVDRTTEPLPSDTGAGNEAKPLNPVWSRPERATFSIDGGRTWRHTAPGAERDGRMVYEQSIDAETALFAWGPPFTTADAAALVKRIAAEHPFAATFELARTREGRPVPGLIVRDGELPEAERLGIWIQARQHAWESGGSWVGRGFVEWLVGDDERAAALRRKSIVYYVPLMDVDSVATGNGGKGQAPQDHNRDWSAKPHFPEVAAAQRRIRQLSEAGRFDFFADLHNPSAGEKRPYFFVSPDDILAPPARKNLVRFLDAARAEMTGPLAIEAKPKPSGPSYSPKWREISKNWVTLNAAPHVVAVTLETAWNTPHSTAEGYQTVGRQLGLAIEAYLRTSPRGK